MPTSVTPDFKYRRIGSDYIEPSDAAESENLAGVRYIQVTVSGTATFRHDDGSLSVPVPLSPGSTFSIGLDVRNIMATGTSFQDDEIIPYEA